MKITEVPVGYRDGVNRIFILTKEPHELLDVKIDAVSLQYLEGIRIERVEANNIVFNVPPPSQSTLLVEYECE